VEKGKSMAMTDSKKKNGPEVGAAGSSKLPKFRYLCTMMSMPERAEIVAKHAGVSLIDK